MLIVGFTIKKFVSNRILSNYCNFIQLYCEKPIRISNLVDKYLFFIQTKKGQENNMSICPFCQNDLEKKMTICLGCNAKKGYLKVSNDILGKNVLIFFGLIVPFMIILYAISAQNLFGVYVSIIMGLPILFAIFHLILGDRWMK